MQEIEDRDLGWGPRTRHLDLFLHVSLSLWGGNHAASRRPAGVYTYTGRSREQGQAHYQFYGNLNSSGSMVRAAGQDR